MKLTAGHDCLVDGCDGLAVYGDSASGVTRWACHAHAHLIGFHRPAFLLGADGSGSGSPPVEAGPPVARSRPAATYPSQGRLL